MGTAFAFKVAIDFYLCGNNEAVPVYISNGVSDYSASQYQWEYAHCARLYPRRSRSGWNGTHPVRMCPRGKATRQHQATGYRETTMELRFLLRRFGRGFIPVGRGRQNQTKARKAD